MRSSSTPRSRKACSAGNRRIVNSKYCREPQLQNEEQSAMLEIGPTLRSDLRVPEKIPIRQRREERRRKGLQRPSCVNLLTLPRESGCWRTSSKASTP